MIQRRHECARINTEDIALALVPDRRAADDVPFPAAHLSGRQRQAAQTLALAQLQCRGGEGGGALGNACFQLAVELFELPRLAEKLDKYLDLRAQDFRNNRHRHVVHGAHFVAAQAIDVSQQDRGNKNQCGLLEARVIADHGRELKAVDVRHVDVNKYDRDVVLEKELERLRGVARAQQIFANILENGAIGKQFRRLIVDEQDVDLVVSHDVLAV